MNFLLPIFAGASVPLYVMFRERGVPKKACQEPWLSAIESGEKEFEGRMFVNPFWAKTKHGDRINFYHPQSGKIVRTHVVGRCMYQNFDVAYKNLGDKLIPDSVCEKLQTGNMTPDEIYRDLVWRPTGKYNDADGNFDEDEYNRALQQGVVAVQLKVHKGIFWWFKGIFW